MMWLVSVPEVWHCLMQHLNGRPSTVPLIDTLLQEAAGQVHSPLDKQVASPTVTEMAFASETGSVVVPEITLNPPVSEINRSLPSATDDTRTLLSLFQSTD
ncbi:hypothetical protein Xinn_04179 [Xenorhabdus innexi]|nr:hypothetical protein Xinn_04179 [Xenorhabdus innexi]